MEKDKSCFDELNDSYDLILGSYQQLHIILDKLHSEGGTSFDGDIILELLNKNLAEWGENILSNVRVNEELVGQLLKNGKSKKQLQVA